MGNIICCVILILALVIAVTLLFIYLRRRMKNHKAKGGMAYLREKKGTVVELEETPTMVLPPDKDIKTKKFKRSLLLKDHPLLLMYLQNPLLAFADDGKIVEIRLTKFFSTSIGKLFTECDLDGYRDDQIPLNLNEIFSGLGILEECNEIYTYLCEHNMDPVASIYQGNSDNFVYAPESVITETSEEIIVPEQLDDEPEDEYNKKPTNVVSPMEGSKPPFITSEGKRADARYWFSSGTSIKYPLMNITYYTDNSGEVVTDDNGEVVKYLLVGIHTPDFLPPEEDIDDLLGLPGYKEGDTRHFPVFSTYKFKASDKLGPSDGMADIIPATMTEYAARYAYEIAIENGEEEIEACKIAAYVILCAYLINYCGATTHAALYNADIGSEFGYTKMKGGEANIEEIIEAINAELRNIDQKLDIFNILAYRLAIAEESAEEYHEMSNTLEEILAPIIKSLNKSLIENFKFENAIGDYPNTDLVEYLADHIEIEEE